MGNIINRKDLHESIKLVLETPQNETARLLEETGLFMDMVDYKGYTVAIGTFGHLNEVFNINSFNKFIIPRDSESVFIFGLIIDINGLILRGVLDTFIVDRDDDLPMINSATQIISSSDKINIRDIISDNYLTVPSFCSYYADTYTNIIHFLNDRECNLQKCFTDEIEDLYCCIDKAYFKSYQYIENLTKRADLAIQIQTKLDAARIIAKGFVDGAGAISGARQSKTGSSSYDDFGSEEFGVNE